MFVTFEGIDGAGKTSMLEEVQKKLCQKGCPLCVTREPGGTFFGNKIRELVLATKTKNLSNRAELFLFLADRAQHVETVIQPALKRGDLVLCDRYTDSTRAYQGGGRGFDATMLEQVLAASTGGLEPDLTLLFDLPARQGLERAQARNHLLHGSVDESRFDDFALAFHEAVRTRYLEVAKNNQDRIVVIDASQDFQRVRDAVFAVFSARTGFCV
ncbi:MAG: dTMP kinase [Desulfovibrio sp.]|nr:dTMP kinase [Desulfovibrio sp.]